MSVKKLLLLSAAGLSTVAMTSALAGGPEVAPPPIAADNGVYLEAWGGYARSAWAHTFNNPPAGTIVFNSGSNGSGTFGFDLGYQWNQYFAAELGWFWLPRPTISGAFGGGRIESWFLYLAFKLIAPLADNFDMFFKAGIAFRRVLNTGINGIDANVWRPVFGVGFMYTFNANWMLSIQYMYLARGSRISVGGFPAAPALFLPTPSVHMALAGIGYLFAL